MYRRTEKVGVVQAWFCRRMKEDLNIQLKGTEGDYWLGTEAGSIGAYGLQGAVFATDGVKRKLNRASKGERTRAR